MAPPRSSHGRHASWSGPLSNLSSDAHRNSFVFSSHPKTPIQDDPHKGEDQYEYSCTPSHCATLSRKATSMPVAPYPYVQVYRPSFDETHIARPHYRKHRHSAPAPSTHDLRESTNHHGHTRSLSNGSLTFLPKPDGGRKRYSSSSHPLHPPLLRHWRARSESLLLSRKKHSQPQRDYFLGVPAPSEFHNSPTRPSRGRANSLTEPLISHHPRASIHATPPHYDPLPLPMVSRHEPHRVRFILPAQLHDYLRIPPFRISIKRPLSPEILAYYHPYLDQPATNPPVSILLIKTSLLPWPIRLGGYLSVRQVLDGICAALRTAVTPDEYDALADDRAFREDVIEAYWRRKAQERRLGVGEGVMLEPMRRVDWLAGRTVFEGLEESGEGVGVWCLRLGWKKLL